jgi:hypothetical protein
LSISGTTILITNGFLDSTLSGRALSDRALSGGALSGRALSDRALSDGALIKKSRFLLWPSFATV